MHTSNSNKLFYGQIKKVIDIQALKKSDVANMLSITESYTNRGNIIDRLGRIQSTFNYEINPHCVLPTDLTGFNMTFEDCCLESAQNVLETSKKLNKPILLMYSGGVDSTSILVSLLMSENLNDLKDRLIISMSLDSIHENPTVYYKYIQNNFKIVSSFLLDRYCSKDYIVVTGDLADMTYPYKHTQNALRRYGYDAMNNDWKNKILYNQWWMDSRNKIELSSRDIAQKDLWWDLLIDNINHAPCEIETNFDFFWWSYFNLNWQHFYFGYTLARLPNIDKDLIDNYYKVFFASQNFQKWAISTGRYESRTDIYKPQAKEFIFKFTKDEDYFIRKGKKISLPKMMVFSPLNKSITADYQMITNNTLENFYNPNNSFNK